MLLELEESLAVLKQAHLERRRRVVDAGDGVRLEVDGREVLLFGSNDYLGLARHPRVCVAAAEAIGRFGVGAGASHLISGHTQAHEALERELASYVGDFVTPKSAARALFFSSGYMANLGILTALARRGDAIFADKLNHACLNDGALLSRADFYRYRHLDLEALEQMLRHCRARRKIICTDAVFSMDGDIAPLSELLALADTHDAWLVVDDAHGFGVLGESPDCGRGTIASHRLRSNRLVMMGTLGKAAGVAGAFVVGERRVIEWLLQKARTYIFTTASPPLLAAALLTSLELVRDDASRRRTLHRRIEQWQDMAKCLPWSTLPSKTAIQPLMVGDDRTAVRLSKDLWQRGMWVPAIRPPTVPKGSARLRVTLSAAHGEDDLGLLFEALVACAK